MTTLLADIARIIQNERAAQGWSTAELASKANVRLERLEALKHGKPSVSTVDLDRLADILGLDPVALAYGKRIVGDSSVVFLRQASAGYQDFSPNDADFFAWALAQGKALFALRQKEPDAKFRNLPVEDVWEGPDNATAKQGYELARRLRSLLGRASESIDDMRSLLEDQFGIVVLQAPLETKRLPAVAVRQADRRGAAVILNANDEERRTNPVVDRVHLAHELCHILFDRTESGIQLVMETEGKEDLLEQRARAFAAEFLAPSSSFAEILEGKSLVTNAGARQAAIRIREEFRVPWELSVRQLQNHRGLSEDLAKQLMVAGAGPYPKPATLLPASSQTSIALCNALEAALCEGSVTEGQVRSLLGLGLVDPFPWETHGSAF